MILLVKVLIEIVLKLSTLQKKFTGAPYEVSFWVFYSESLVSFAKMDSERILTLLENLIEKNVSNESKIVMGFSWDHTELELLFVGNIFLFLGNLHNFLHVQHLVFLRKATTTYRVLLILARRPLELERRVETPASCLISWIKRNESVLNGLREPSHDNDELIMLSMDG
jgi:hypothetical protein